MAKSKTTKATKRQVSNAKQPFRPYNLVQLGGRLVSDPDLRHTPSGKPVCRLRVATNDTQTAQFHDVIVWELPAEVVAQELRKGAVVYVDGRLQTRTWQAADGSTRRATEVIALAVKSG